MGWAKDQRERLRRKRWTDPDELSQELYAMMTADMPFVVDSPVVVSPGADTRQPALTLREFGTGDVAVQIEHVEAPPIVTPVPGIDLGDAGDLTLTITYGDGETERYDGRERGDPTPPARGSGQSPNREQSSGGGGVPMKVVSGSGQTYQVEAYLDGPTGAATNVTATHLSTLAEGESIEAGTWAVGGKIGSTYFFQVPVWQA